MTLPKNDAYMIKTIEITITLMALIDTLFLRGELILIDDMINIVTVRF